MDDQQSMKLFFFPFLFLQQCQHCLLQSADGQRSDQCTAPAPAPAAGHVHPRIPVAVAAGGLLPLSVLLADLPLRQSDAVHSVPGRAVRRVALSQLLADAAGCKYI